MNKATKNRLGRFLLNHLLGDSTVESYASEQGITAPALKKHLTTLLGQSYSVTEVAKLLDMSPQWVTKYARRFTLGERTVWYGDKKRYVFHEPDIEELRATKQLTKKP